MVGYPLIFSRENSNFAETSKIFQKGIIQGYLKKNSEIYLSRGRGRHAGRPASHENKFQPKMLANYTQEKSQSFDSQFSPVKSH